MPLDALHSRDAARLEETFAMALDLNCNMLRCWGGNVYEDHAFFELCDANGVLVWQDFSLACFLYPQDREFCDAIRAEAEFIIRKLRNHPSLALWAGNNEIDSVGFDWWPLKSDPNRWDKLSREVLAQAVQTFDPVRDYLPSSPYYAPELIAEGAPHGRKPEDHLWGPRNDFKGDFYMKSNAHFVSEIGYHGCPSPASMRDMLDPEAVWPWRENDQWLTRAVRPMPGEDGYNYRIPLMARQIAVLFDSEPQTLEEFCLASQISQAEADKFFIEKWRSEKEWRGGLLWWNVRDCWPILSDAVVDWYGRRKLAYAYIKASQRDVCTIVTEAAQGVHRPVVVNDTSRPVSGVVTIRDGESGEVLLHADFCCAAGFPESRRPPLRRCGSVKQGFPAMRRWAATTISPGRAPSSCRASAAGSSCSVMRRTALKGSDPPAPSVPEKIRGSPMQTPPGNAPEPHFTSSRAEQVSQPAIQPEPPTSYLRKSGKACFGRFDRMLQSPFPFMQFLHFINPPQDLQSSSKFHYILFWFIIKPEFAILPLFFILTLFLSKLTPCAPGL